jgi:hypothetical protein
MIAVIDLCLVALLANCSTLVVYPVIFTQFYRVNTQFRSEQLGKQ